MSKKRPTLLDVITKTPEEIPLYTAIHKTNENNIFIIPANNQLESANHYLAASGMSVSALRNRLYQTQGGEEEVVKNFGIVIVDPPPERSHLALTSLGCGNFWVIPTEANVKGIQSLLRTLELVNNYKFTLPYGSLLGAIPFRAKWVGLNPTKATSDSLALINKILGESAESIVFPHILESEIYKRAISEQTLPRYLNPSSNLEYPLLSLIEKILPSLGKYAEVYTQFQEVA